jgi:hypothetical protein
LAGSANGFIEAHGASRIASWRLSGKVFIAPGQWKATVGLVEDPSIVSVITGQAISFLVTGQTVVRTGTASRCRHVSKVTIWTFRDAQVLVEKEAFKAGDAVS